jgi:DNA-binding MarR family transcriptional regulator
MVEPSALVSRTMPTETPTRRATRAADPDVALAAGSPDPRTIEAVRALTKAAKVMERASGGLSLAHYRVLAAVAAGDERASRVAARLALGKPTVSASVDALCTRGLLVRSGVAGDQRAIQLTLTEAGRRLVDEAEGAMMSHLEALVARTGRRDELIDSLVSLGEAINQAVAERRP